MDLPDGQMLQLASGLVAEARCPEAGIVEAIRSKGEPWVAGVQWHPELHWRKPDLLDPEPMLVDFLHAARAGRRGFDESRQTRRR